MPTRGVLTSLRCLGVGLACLALAVVCVAPGTARANGSLVLSSADFSTLHLRPVAESVGKARAELGAGLTAGVRAVLGTAQVEASGSASRGQRWSSDAFVLGSASAARLVLADWRRVHHAQRVRVGAGGAALVQRSRRRIVVQVLWRDAARLGVIALSATRGLGGARAHALSYAVLANSNLQKVLPRTAWGKLMAQVRPNGSVSEQTALEAFALSYGPLPGVHVPSGPRGSIESGDLAYDWVAPYLSRLSRPLRRDIDHAMGLSVGRRGVRAHVDHYGDPGFRPDTALTAAANHWAQVYAMPSYLGHSLRLQIVAGFTSTSVSDPKTGDLALADTLTVNASGNPTADGPYCRIRITPAADNVTNETFRHILAHEVFHCEEFDLDPGLPNLGNWVIEGLADWAATSLAPDPGSLGWFTQYVATPNVPLFERTYDAMGFWGHIQDTEQDLWQKIPTVLAQETPKNQYIAAGGFEPDFLTTWGSSFFNDPAYAPDWRIESPQATDDQASPGGIAGSEPSQVIAAPYTTSQYVLDPIVYPLERVSITPGSDALLAEGVNRTNLSDELFCTASSMSDCQCPPGDEGTVPPSEMLSLPASLGITGDPNGGTAGTVTPIPLSLYCKQEPLTPPSQPGTRSNVAVGGSGGDPHLYDFEGGDLFDFQQAGEFTLVKSTRDDLDIQVRQQPLGNCCVSFDTAVAIRAGHDTVEVDASKSGGDFAIYVNKALMHASHHTLGGGADLSVHGYADATVTWPDGTTAAVGDAGALYITVTLSADRFGHVQGLLGNADVPADREFTGANGDRYRPKVITGTSRHDTKVRYGKFGASWRITQRESLFRYPAGKNTRSYDVRGFPARYETVSSLPAPKQAAAKKQCRRAGIKSGRALDGCALDVGATGDNRFAAGDARLRASVLRPVLSTPGQAAVVSLGSVQDSYTPPHIVVDAAGTGYTSWANGASGAALDFCRLAQGAASCASRQSFSYPPGADLGSDAGNAPVFTAGGQLALLDSRCCLTSSQKFLLLSSDGGATFTAPTPIVSDESSGMAGNVLDLPPDALFAGSPEQLLTSDTGPVTNGGSIQATGLAPVTTDPGWFAPQTASLSESIGLQGSTLIAVVTSPTTPYSVSWVRYVAGDPNAASSWSAPQTLSPAPSLDSNAQLAGGPAGIFVARSIATPGDNERLVLQKFTGAGWTSPVAITTGVEGERFAVDETPAGIVYVIWTNSKGALQYAIATSPAATRFGATQTLPTRGDVEFPQIAINAKGFGWATWTNASSPSEAFALPILPPSRLTH